jgi:hypothetical protein
VSAYYIQYTSYFILFRRRRRCRWCRGGDFFPYLTISELVRIFAEDPLSFSPLAFWALNDFLRRHKKSPRHTIYVYLYSIYRATRRVLQVYVRGSYYYYTIVIEVMIPGRRYRNAETFPNDKSICI